MPKKILVIGGTYFSGRVFSIYASRRLGEYELTVLNRGNRPLAKQGVEELVANRCDKEGLASVLGGRTFDAVVDFCAYNPGDIANVIDSGISFDRYIELSTVNVYDPSATAPICEDAPRRSVESIMARRDYPAELKGYLAGKRILEDELERCCADRGASYTILRPSFIYGPFDYTPRLIQYLQWVARNEPVPFPANSDSKFSFIYVKDLANLLFKVLECDGTRDAAFNLAAPDAVDWPRFEGCISNLTEDSQEHVHLTVAEIDEKRLPIMFPLDADEWYDGARIAEAVGGFDFTPFEVGLRETWDVFKDVLAR